MKKLLLIPFLLVSTLCFASAPNRTYNYVSHAVIDPVQNNANENALYSYLQNGVDTFATGSISDISVSDTAAIAYHKLNLLNSIINADIGSSAAISYSKLNLTGSVVNADIASGAAIVDSKLATISTAGKVSGAALTSISSTPSGAGVWPTANLGSGTANSGTILYGDQTYKTAPSSTSNVLFQYSAVTSNGVTLGTGQGEIIGSSLVPTTGGTYRFLEAKLSNQSTYVPVWLTKWKKIAGVSTIIIYGEIWQNSGSDSCNLKVDVGGANGNITGTANQITPEWKTFTIDVSGLSNGTVYDVTVSIEHPSSGGNVSIYLGNLIAFGS